MIGRRWNGSGVVVLLMAVGAHAAAYAGPRVSVIVQRDAPRLERFAANELAGQFRKLFDAEVTIGYEIPREKSSLVVIGSPRTNPILKPVEGKWPELSFQGHALKSIDLNGRPALAVGGGSPVATLWAVYELGHRFGIRYMLFGDLFPVKTPEMKLDDFDVVLEPTLKLRTWRTVNDFPIGPESWGMAEHRLVIGQLAKLKYNRIMLAFYPWQPFVDFEFDGVKRQSDKLWFGWKYPVDGDTAGRGVFGGAKYFDNPDFSGKSTYTERIEAGRRLANGIIDLAHDLGMTAAIAISPLEFPKEFAAALPNARPSTELEPLSIGPGASQPPDDPKLMELAKTQIRAYLRAYPTIDALYLTLPEFPDWVDHAETSWKRLDEQTGIGKLTNLEAVTKAARDRTVIASGDRGERALRGNIAGIDFLRRLLAEDRLLRVRGVTIKPVLVDADPALYPFLDKLLPSGTGALHFVDYTAKRVVENRGLLAKAPVKTVPSSLILTLADDNVGLLPQFSGTAIHELVKDLRALGWQGFSTRYWIIGDLDLSAYFLSRASFGSDITPQQACLDLLTPITDEAVPQSVWKAFAMIEQATGLIDANDIGFSFPVPGVILKHYQSDAPVPKWWGEVRDLYLNAMNEMYRANSRARAGGRDYSLYLARRYEFAFEYMNCVEAVRLAGIAKRAGDVDEQRSKLEAAVESMHSALNALAAVTRSNCDRGVIAVLNEYGYRPLKAELEKVEEAAASK